MNTDKLAHKLHKATFIGYQGDSIVLKHKNVSSIEEYNIGDRLKYSRIKQSSKKNIEESRINVKYQEHYRSIWNSAKCKVQSAKYKVQSAI